MGAAAGDLLAPRGLRHPPRRSGSPALRQRCSWRLARAHARPRAPPARRRRPRGVPTSRALTRRRSRRARFVLVAAAVVGFAFLLMELVWYRMLGPLLGGSFYTFGLILAVALLGIGLGGRRYAVWARAGRATLRWLRAHLRFEALCIVVPLRARRSASRSSALLLRPLGGRRASAAWCWAGRWSRRSWYSRRRSSPAYSSRCSSRCSARADARRRPRRRRSPTHGTPSARSSARSRAASA